MTEGTVVYVVLVVMYVLLLAAVLYATLRWVDPQRPSARRDRFMASIGGRCDR